MKTWTSGLVAAAGLALAAAMPAQAEQMTLTSGFPPGSIPPVAHQALADWLKANSDLEVSVTAMTLLSLPESSPGVRDGIADMAYILTQYYPAEYANSNLAADMTMLTTVGTPTDAPGVVMAAAFADYVLFNCPNCLEEFKAQNQVYLGSGASSAYALMCAKPITSIEDLKGKKIRVGGGNFGRWAEHFGATRVTLPGAEMYEALAQGVVDCSTLSTPEIVNWSLFDVLKQVILGAPGGVFAGVASNNINLDTWRGLNDDQRAKLMYGAAHVSAGVAVGYQAQAKDAEAMAKEKGIDIGPASAELKAASDAFVAADMKTVAEQFKTKYNLQDVDARMTMIAGLIEKWKGLMNGVDGTDHAAVTDLLWRELYSKVDLKTYGLN
jgi:TRAP-type transport system periplasmic protein